jgi:serine/threonine protein kinase
MQHAVFMHKHHIVHLDISLRNIVTDYEGHYAYIDYETSRRFNGTTRPLIFGHRATEVPPECERGEYVDPYKVDVWALAVLILRACKVSPLRLLYFLLILMFLQLAGFHVPELMHVIKPMLHEIPHRRPSSCSVLLAFDCIVSMMQDRPLNSACSTSDHAINGPL